MVRLAVCGFDGYTPAVRRERFGRFIGRNHGLDDGKTACFGVETVRRAEESRAVFGNGDSVHFQRRI